MILHALPDTLIIVVYALIAGTLIGSAIGVLAASHAGSIWDGLATSISSLGVALPGFWLAMMLVSIFAMQMRWSPSAGQFGGFAKLGSGSCQAANLSPSFRPAPIVA